MHIPSFSSLLRPQRPKRPQRSLQDGPEGSKTTPEALRMSHDIPKTAPSEAQYGPRSAQDGPRQSQGRSRCPRRPPRRPQTRPKTAQEAPKTAQEGPKTAQGGPKMSPRCSKRPPRGSQETSKGATEAQKRPQDSPTSPPQRFQNSLEEASKEAPKGMQDASGRRPMHGKMAPRVSDGERPEMPSWLTRAVVVVVCFAHVFCR